MPGHARAVTPGHEDTQSLASRLLGLRGELSQMEFARRLGVDVKTVTRWEKGSSAPDAASLVLLRDRFGADPTWLLTGQGCPPGPAGTPTDARANASASSHLGADMSHYQQRQAGYAAALMAQEPRPAWSVDLAAAEAQRHARRVHLYRRLADLADHCGDEQLGLLLGVAEQLRAASVAASRPAPPHTPPGAAPGTGDPTP